MLTRWRMEVVVLLFHVYLHISLQNEHSFKRLNPDAILIGEVLHHKESAYYLLSKLEPSYRYELRISYAATTPTDFVISLERDTEEHNGRKLLNIEKIVFENVPAKVEQLVKVTAMRTGVPYDMERLAEPVVYNIVLETLYLGLPLEVWKMGVILLLCIGFVMKLAVPWMIEFLYRECVKVKKVKE